MPSKKRSSRLEERLQKEAQKLKEKLEKELAPKRGSGEPLSLQCTEEELTTAQQAFQTKLNKEFKEICNKLDTTIKRFNGELIYKGDAVQSFSIGEKTPPALNNKSITLGKGDDAFTLSMDKSTGLIMAKMLTAGPGVTVTPLKKGARTVSGRRSTGDGTDENSGTTVKPTESTAVGGLATGKPPPTIDLTTDDGKPAADSRELSFSKLQGKTYPSLVVIAKPGLRSKEAAALNDRPTLDAKVKSVLLHTPTKFTEWLIQQGLIRCEQLCSIHAKQKLKLGMYSDVTKFPYSGGYVWISECCPNRFVSVFNGSLFEAASHPPSVLLKLIYHWACQTNIQNIVQWVKVDNLYVKTLFTWLRAACTVALNQHVGLLGGPNKKIEVGVISLGTSVDGHQRQLKVEVLGVLDPETKNLRLRAAEPQTDGNRGRKHAKISEILKTWVHPESIIMTDSNFDTSSLNAMGFYNVRTGATDAALNQNIIDYLRRIVPRMFQNTLSLLSRQIIQQFLDELVWREWFGSTAAQAFDSIVAHLAEQTRTIHELSLTTRLSKVAANPFPKWVFLDGDDIGDSGASTSSDGPTAPKNAKRRRGNEPALSPAPATSAPAAKKRNLAQEVVDVDYDDALAPSSPAPSGALETYYYGSMDGRDTNMSAKLTIDVTCGIDYCTKSFMNNIELLEHIFEHAQESSTTNAHTCRYCLATYTTRDDMQQHVEETHPSDTIAFNTLICLICELRFASANQLTKHMSQLHCAAELPYECGVCYARTSSHRAAVDHFYTEHDATAMLQCPFCLKCVSAWCNDAPSTQNILNFAEHLRKHVKKLHLKKCGKCALTFIFKDVFLGTLKEHTSKAHKSLAGSANVHKWPSSSSSVILARTNTSPGYTPQNVALRALAPQPIMDLTNLKITVPDAFQCKECGDKINRSRHFTGSKSCTKCSFNTFCERALDKHKKLCADKHAVALPLPREMFCSCGFASSDGNALAKHLALCERKSAFTSLVAARMAAQSNRGSMLDVLGLVRKPGEDSEVEKTTSEEGASNGVTKAAVVAMNVDA